jgi:hypothetical protein
MSKRDDQGRYARKGSPKYIAFIWIFSLLSAGLLLVAGKAVLGVFGSFRSCESNVGLVVRSCGKNSINLGDAIIIGLFILTAFLAVSLFTASLRTTRGVKK